MERALVELGRVVGPHGVRGIVRLRFFGDGPDNLLRAERLWLAAEGDEQEPREIEIVSAGSGRPGEVRLGIRGVEDRDAAQALRGRRVLGEAEALEPLPEGEHYWYELIGCEVMADGRRVGRVREIWETGAHDVLVVEGDHGTCLVPTARQLIQEIDVESGRIVIEAPPGLLDDALGT